jgi:hypothetical protein
MAESRAGARARTAISARGCGVSGGVEFERDEMMYRLSLPGDANEVLLYSEEALMLAAKIVAAVGDDDKFQKCLALVRET